jgi:hypothetical protein
VKIFHIGAVLLPLLALGCRDSASPQKSTVGKQASIQANLDKLDPADREIAQKQKYCAIETENPLGSMGKPVKVMLNDQPVFLCCKGCEKTAKEHPDETLKTVEKLMAASTAPVRDASQERP